jgi:type I restriction enzyme M protein
MYSSAFRPSTSSDPFGRYYTAAAISWLLVSQMTVKRPKLVLDLGAGSGELTRAALMKWRRAHVVAVDSHLDIDPGTRPPVAGQFCTYRTDALNPNLAAEIGLRHNSLHAAVCNPPFIRPRWRKQFGELLESAGLSGCYPAVAEAGATVLFLAQNLQLLRTGGQLGLIVPDGIVSGFRHKNLRKTLLEQHVISDAIELPSGTFSRTEVKTHILVIRKGPQKANTVRLRRFDADGVTAPILLDIEAAIGRFDFTYHAQRRSTESSDMGPARLLRHLNPQLQRGRACSADRHALPRRVFHTTDFPQGTRIALPSSGWRWNERQAAQHGQVLAWPGDILLARVGRNLEKKVGVLVDGPVAISDCVFRLQVPPNQREALVRCLTSPSGRSALRAIASGTGARYLSKTELLNMPLRQPK